MDESLRAADYERSARQKRFSSSMFESESAQILSRQIHRVGYHGIVLPASDGGFLVR